MVLYHLSTTYQLLYCIVHRLARHPKEDAGLLMVEYIFPEKERRDMVQKLLDTDLMNKKLHFFKIISGGIKNFLGLETMQQNLEALIV